MKHHSISDYVADSLVSRCEGRVVVSVIYFLLISTRVDGAGFFSETDVKHVLASSRGIKYRDFEYLQELGFVIYVGDYLGERWYCDAWYWTNNKSFLGRFKGVPALCSRVCVVKVDSKRLLYMLPADAEASGLEYADGWDYSYDTHALQSSSSSKTASVYDHTDAVGRHYASAFDHKDKKRYRTYEDGELISESDAVFRDAQEVDSHLSSDRDPIFPFD